MHTLSAETASTATRRNRSELEERLQDAVTQVLHGLNSKTILRERRRDKRFAFPRPIHLTPVDDTDRPVGETIVVLGKHLSEGGLDFYHEAPLPYRRAVASIETGAGQWVSLSMVLTWCRFTRHGWYENGGRFLEVVETPLPAVEHRSRTA